MLNVDESLSILTRYNIPRDIYRRGLLYATGVVVFVDLLRAQISEINLLQLVPGLYVLLLFLSFVFLMFSAAFFFKLAFQLDIRKRLGTKTFTRMDFYIRLKTSVFLFVTVFFAGLTNIVPVSLDFFDSYDEVNLTSLWSFTEVLFIESILLFILFVFSQIPIILLIVVGTEVNMMVLPEVWRTLSFFIFVFSGFITPTIDGYTQVSFSFFAISLYLIILNFLEKRIPVKEKGMSSLNS